MPNQRGVGKSSDDVGICHVTAAHIGILAPNNAIIINAATVIKILVNPMLVRYPGAVEFLAFERIFAQTVSVGIGVVGESCHLNANIAWEGRRRANYCTGATTTLAFRRGRATAAKPRLRDSV